VAQGTLVRTPAVCKYWPAVVAIVGAAQADCRALITLPNPARTEPA
jgi:hypothetical protein